MSNEEKDDEYNIDYNNDYNTILENIIGNFVHEYVNTRSSNLIYNFFDDVEDINVDNVDSAIDSIFNENDVMSVMNRIALDYISGITNTNIDTDIIDTVLNRSFNEQPVIEKDANRIIDIPIIKYSDVEDKDKYNKDCCICLSLFEDDSEVSMLECNHAFHNDCIVEWGMYNLNCPICRKNI